jgi:hypothetical protein
MVRFRHREKRRRRQAHAIPDLLKETIARRFDDRESGTRNRLRPRGDDRRRAAAVRIVASRRSSFFNVDASIFDAA